MPRYFFDLTNNGDSVADEVGEEFELVEAALARAAIKCPRDLSDDPLSHRNQAAPLASRGDLDAIRNERQHRPCAME
jgi:hypothetical protein